MHFLMTTDVENFSIPLNRMDDNTAKEVHEVGLPRLLDLYAKHDIKCTFYFTGTMCELLPDSVGLVKAHGHEIGCHSYSHAQDKALDVLSYEEQLNEIKKQKESYTYCTLKSTPSAYAWFYERRGLYWEMIMRQLFILLTSKEYYEKNEKLNDC